jgi:hypothetical protein
MKPPIKLAMMQALGAQLPPAHLTEDVFSVMSHRLWIALATDSCLVLSWRDAHHVTFNDWLLSRLSPPVYQYCRAHMRFDGVPPQALTPDAQ